MSTVYTMNNTYVDSIEKKYFFPFLSTLKFLKKIKQNNFPIYKKEKKDKEKKII